MTPVKIWRELTTKHNMIKPTRTSGEENYIEWSKPTQEDNSVDRFMQNRNEIKNNLTNTPTSRQGHPIGKMTRKKSHHPKEDSAS